MAITVNVVGAVVIIMAAVLADKVSEKWKKWCWAYSYVWYLRKLDYR